MLQRETVVFSCRCRHFTDDLISMSVVFLLIDVVLNLKKSTPPFSLTVFVSCHRMTFMYRLSVLSHQMHEYSAQDLFDDVMNCVTTGCDFSLSANGMWRRDGLECTRTHPADLMLKRRVKQA